MWHVYTVSNYFPCPFIQLVYLVMVIWFKHPYNWLFKVLLFLLTVDQSICLFICSDYFWGVDLSLFLLQWDWDICFVNCNFLFMLTNTTWYILYCLLCPPLHLGSFINIFFYNVSGFIRRFVLSCSSKLPCVHVLWQVFMLFI